MDPYKSQPARAFWRRAVSESFDPADVATVPRPLIRADDKIVSAGSCFAANIVPPLEAAGFTYLRTEHVPDDEALSYPKFSAGYGNVYTARQLLQLMRRALRQFSPVEDRWHLPEGIVDTFRPGMRYLACSDREFDALRAQHLRAALRAFSECSVFVFTLGLTEAWVSKLDGAVFPACPGTLFNRGSFDPDRHAFQNFTVNQVASDLLAFIALLREINPAVRVILTVSPVPLVATATNRHVLAATIYSKSVLRVAAEMAHQSFADCHYFPAYEIVTGPQAPQDFLDPDRREPSTKAIAAVMSALLAACDQSASAPKSAEAAPTSAAELSTMISAIECEEAAQDPDAR